MDGRAYIGTSGWSYEAWRDNFYSGVPRKDWLRYAASRFTALEVNGTFYHQMPVSSYEGWKNATPPDFRFAVKAHRYLTHVKKLGASEESFEQQHEAAAGLGEKLAAILWQIPANLHRDDDRLERFVKLLGLWPETRHAMEFRHLSWFHDEVAAVLRRNRLAVCQSDSGDWPMWDAVTTNLVYIRLHGRPIPYVSPYSVQELRNWTAKIRRWQRDGREVHVYFDNTDAGNAPHDAIELLRMVQEDRVKRGATE
jgi:uncharacterized protein YecE (DUF72 family)